MTYQESLATEWKKDAPRLVPHDPSRRHWVGDCQEDVELTSLATHLEEHQKSMCILQNASDFARWTALKAEGYGPIPENVHAKVKSEYCASVTVKVVRSENRLNVTVSVYRIEHDCP
jgi:hypothetical protein